MTPSPLSTGESPSDDEEKRVADASIRDVQLSLSNEYEDNSRVPRLSLPRIFWLFFVKFGLFAWGGPVAQIALIKEQLVTRDQWITLPRFNRVFAVYQILPGPEAAELCMFFGCLSGGRLGGVVAGIGFILPGFVLMLVASYVYVVVGFGNTYFDASFRALQPLVAAMVRRFVDSPDILLLILFSIDRFCVQPIRLRNMRSFLTKLRSGTPGCFPLLFLLRLTAP